MKAISPQPLPLFIRIREKLMREITAGRWKDGERFPTEQELSISLGAAVGTIRKAVDELVAMQLLVRRQGSGTYVSFQFHAAGTPAKPMKSIYGFFHLELLGGGGLPTAQVIECKRVRHPVSVPAFGESARSMCYRVRRLRYLDDTPVALEEIWFDARHRADLKASALGEALYQFYQDQLGFWISHVEDQVGAGTVPGWAGAPFALAIGQPCGMIVRKAWAGTNVLEEFSTTWFDSDRARYCARWP